MITLTLPSEERRVFLRSFWIALSGLAVMPWLILAWALRAPQFGIAAAASAVLMGAVPFFREDLAWRVYRAWNRRLVDPFGAAAGDVVMRICFGIIYVATASGGSRLPRVDGRAVTSWTTRGSLPPDSYRSLFAAASSGGRGGWVRDYVWWARQTGNLWSLSLLPYLGTLRLVTRKEERAVQANIYTLF
jgi:hypothetical protein